MPTVFDSDLLSLLKARDGALDPAAAGAAARLRRKFAAPPRAAKPGAGKPAPAASASPSSWFPFIGIDVRHGYCNRTGGVCAALEIRPTPLTQQRLARFGMIARPRPDGIDILWRSAFRDAAEARMVPLLKQLSTLSARDRKALTGAVARALFEPPLLFTVALASPLFANFTAMPADLRIGEPPLRLSNRGAAVTDDAAHAADLAVDWTSLVDRAAAVARLEDRKSFIVRQAAEQEGIQLAARSRDFALLELWFAAPSRAAAGSGGWDGMPVGLGGDPGDLFRPTAYRLHFAARETRWRYIVATRDGSAPEERDLSVVDVDGADAGFSPAGATTLPDGRGALCLTRTEPLPILARPEAAFTLTGLPPGGRARRATLVDRLPPAGIEAIAPEAPQKGARARAGEPPPAWSDIYVFV